MNNEEPFLLEIEVWHAVKQMQAPQHHKRSQCTRRYRHRKSNKHPKYNLRNRTHTIRLSISVFIVLTKKAGVTEYDQHRTVSLCHKSTIKNH